MKSTKLFSSMGGGGEEEKEKLRMLIQLIKDKLIKKNSNKGRHLQKGYK